MPRAASASPSSIVPSWLLAAPAMARQRRRGIVSGVNTAPSAHGDSTSHSANRMSSIAEDGDAELGVQRGRAVRVAGRRRSPARPRRPAAGRRSRRRGRCPARRRAGRPGRIAVHLRRTARMPARTPTAVVGDGSPEPPSATLTPVTHGRLERDPVHVPLRRADVFGGDVAAAELVDRPTQRPQRRLVPRPVRDRASRRPCRRPGRGPPRPPSASSPRSGGARRGARPPRES